ncbi:MAG TPA: hypothetical protein VGK87_00845 [Anaerolineae bacterium]
MNEQNLGRLRELLFKEFNEVELTALCQDLGLSYEKLAGEGAFGKTRGLVEAAQARDMIPTLMSKVRDLRPTAYRIAGIRRFTAAPPTVAPAAPATVPVVPPVEPATSPVEELPTAPAPVEPVTSEPNTVLPVAQPAAETVAAPVPEKAPAIPPASASVSAPERNVKSRLGLVVAFIVACLLLSAGGVALNQWLLSQRGAQTVIGANAATAVDAVAVALASPASPSTVTVAPLPTETQLPLPTATTIATMQATAAATAQPIATPLRPTATANPTAAATATPAPSATAPLTASGLAIQSVLEANELLAGFYSSKVTSDTLRHAWAGDTYSFVAAYPTKTLKRSLNIDVVAGVNMTATMRYMRQPSVVGEAGARTQLVSQEYWTYQVGDLVACETIDYSYVVNKIADHYQIVAYRGDVLATATGSDCQ